MVSACVDSKFVLLLFAWFLKESQIGQISIYIGTQKSKTYLRIKKTTEHFWACLLKLESDWLKYLFIIERSLWDDLVSDVVRSCIAYSRGMHMVLQV